MIAECKRHDVGWEVSGPIQYIGHEKELSFYEAEVGNRDEFEAASPAQALAAALDAYLEGK